MFLKIFVPFYMEVLAVPHSHQHLVVSLFNFSHSHGYAGIVLVYIFLITNDIQCYFVFMAICLSFADFPTRFLFIYLFSPYKNTFFVNYEYQWSSLYYNIFNKIKQPSIKTSKAWKDNSLKKYKWPINIKSSTSLLIEEPNFKIEFIFYYQIVGVLHIFLWHLCVL